jgi:acetoin utilization protein AcuB
MKSVPSVKKYMTTVPHTVGAEQFLAKAQQLMQKFQIRHLPVLRGGSLVGIVSDRDIALIETLSDVNPNKVCVEEAMSPVVYTASPDSPFSEVVAEMASHKYGSAVIVDQGHVVGIVTTTDVCRALSEMLKTRLVH